MSKHFQVMILGGGPAGYTAAIRCAQNGLETVLFEFRQVGGTCLNRGCIPTKSLLHGAETLCTVREAASSGINATLEGFDLDKMYARRDEVVSKLRSGVEKLLKARKVTVVNAFASFKDARTVVADGEEYTADDIIIAAGSVPTTLRAEGSELCVNSDFLLEGNNEIPDIVAIVGGGVIGVEFAELLSSLGKKVFVIEYFDRLLLNMDKDVSQFLALSLKKKGVSINCGAAVTKVEKTSDGCKVVFNTSKGESSVEAGLVVVCTGRRAYTEKLALDNAGVKTERGVIVTDENFRTDAKGVWAIGDCVGGMMLAHNAAAQGEYVADLIAKRHNGTNLKVVPSCIYTVPEIAAVGLTEQKAVEAGYEVSVGKFPMGANGKSLIAGRERGFVKLVFDKNTQKLLGATLYCDRATDMIGELALALANGMGKEELERVIRPHPTVEESIGEAVLASDGRAIHSL